MLTTNILIFNHFHFSPFIFVSLFKLYLDADLLSLQGLHVLYCLSGMNAFSFF